MIVRLFTKITSVEVFSISKHHFSYALKSGDLYLDQNKMNVTTSVGGYFFADRYFSFSSNTDLMNYLLDMDSQNLYSLGKVSLQYFIKEKNSFVAIEKSDGLRVLIILSIPGITKTYMGNVDFGLKGVIGQDFLIVNHSFSKLAVLSLLTGTYEWESDLLNELGRYDKIKQVFGVDNGILWLTSQRGVIIGLDSNSGAVKYHINYDNFPTHEEKGSVKMMYGVSMYDAARHQLLGVAHGHYWTIDLTNPVLGLRKIPLEVQNSEYMADSWSRPEGVCFDEKYIYFKDIERSTVGVLNRENGKIEWHARINDLPPRTLTIIKDIQVGGDKIYVLDTGGTLTIFEKE